MYFLHAQTESLNMLILILDLKLTFLINLFTVNFCKIISNNQSKY